MSEQAKAQQHVMDEQEVRESPPAHLLQWVAPVWFLLGVLVGVVGLALFTTFASRLRPDAAAMREAARDGTLDAIATLQAGGPSTGGSQPESRNPDPPKAGKSFAVREANRAGNKNASVTIVEFSDFQ
jgi:hypothetical protein